MVTTVFFLLIIIVNEYESISLPLLSNELSTSGLNGGKVTISLATKCQGLGGGGGNGDKMGGMETFALFLNPPQLMSGGNDTRQPIQLTRSRYELKLLN